MGMISKDPTILQAFESTEYVGIEEGAVLHAAERECTSVAHHYA